MMRDRIVGALLVVLSLLYLSFFVARGWVAHDEGMIGQSAERVLEGGVPHVDYEEPYTGGLTWLYATAFRVSGIDLLHIRWLLFAGASLAQLLTYLILRRSLDPIGAGLGTWLALTWSFPNYFAGLPSWWLLICALASMWSFIKYVESGRVRYAALAGLAVGIAVLVKQTGVYLVVALVMSLLYRGEVRIPHQPGARPGRILCLGAFLSALALALLVVRSRPLLPEFLFLVLPIVMCSCVLLTSDAGASAVGFRNAIRAPGIAMFCAAVPLALFTIPYLVHHELNTLIRGVLILPQKRLQFASAIMPPAVRLLDGVPLLGILLPLPIRAPEIMTGRAATWGLCLLAIGAAAIGLYAAGVYQFIWHSARALAALLPIAVGLILLFRRVTDPKRRQVLFGLATMLAWASLVQFPFSAPIYFCYITPLVVITAASASQSLATVRRPAVAACAAGLLAFALLTLNRGYIYNIGINHETQAFDASLRHDRARLRVDGTEAATYRRVTDLLKVYLGDGQLLAGPDCPEVYFLSGRFSRSGALFDFFAGDAEGAIGTADLSGVDVVVLNHRHRFSPLPSDDLLLKIRRMFPKSETVNWMEVRWR